MDISRGSVGQTRPRAAWAGALGVVLVLVLLLPCRTGAAWSWGRLLRLKPKEATLYVADPVRGSKKTLAGRSQEVKRLVERITADANGPGEGPCLVVVAPGWKEKTTWHKGMALAIRDQLGPGPWVCAWYDWRAQANRLSVRDAALAARANFGPDLGSKIVALSRQWRQVHLIGHAAGCWLVSEAARVIAQQTQASIHLTLLDSYTPEYWGKDELGCVACQPTATCWADHYMTRDPGLVTQRVLAGAHNVDLSAVDPGPKGRRFPIFWYQATITGRFADSRYVGQPLFHRVGEIEYGFARSLEAGPANWEYSRKLRGGNDPVLVIAK